VTEGGSAAMIALGDQVQQACIDAGEPILGFVIIGYRGKVEYRSPLSIEDFRVALRSVADAL
jgi:hypothetical protein